MYKMNYIQHKKIADSKIMLLYSISNFQLKCFLKTKIYCIFCFTNYIQHNKSADNKMMHFYLKLPAKNFCKTELYYVFCFTNSVLHKYKLYSL